MQLPQSDELDIQRLGRLFDNTSEYSVRVFAKL